MNKNNMNRVYNIESTEQIEKFISIRDNELIALKLLKTYLEKAVENINKQIDTYEINQ